MFVRIARGVKVKKGIGMRIFIRDCATAKLLARNGKWTRSEARAMDFEQSLRAWEEIDRLALTGVQIVVRGTESLKEATISVVGCEAAMTS